MAAVLQAQASLITPEEHERRLAEAFEERALCSRCQGHLEDKDEAGADQAAPVCTPPASPEEPTNARRTNTRSPILDHATETDNALLRAQVASLKVSVGSMF